MDTAQLHFRLLTLDDIDLIIPLTLQLNKDYASEKLKTYLIEMFDYKNYNCFGLFLDTKLVGLSSGWTATKLYSGKQLEIDNVVIDSKHQSKGYGALLEKEIYAWCKQRNYKSIELNTYVMNSRSHKFYFNQGYEIIGFHFEKDIK